MENKKISELTETSTINDGCCLPLVQSGETKKIYFDNLKSQVRPTFTINSSGHLIATYSNSGGSFDLGLVVGTDGVDIESVTQTTTSTADEGVNIVTVVLSNGTSSTFEIRNGHKGSTGTSVESITQTTESLEDEGVNLVTVTLSDGTSSTFEIRNGSKGVKGDKGDTGNCYPVGAIYQQLPPVTIDGTTYTPLSPNELWSDQTWVDISSGYGGAFFRANGGNSAIFGTKQNEGLPNIEGQVILMASTSGNITGTGALKDSRNWNTSTFGGGGSNDNDAGIVFDASKSNAIYGNSEHVTPDNFSIKIWLRTE